MLALSLHNQLPYNVKATVNICLFPFSENPLATQVGIEYLSFQIQAP